MKCGRISRFGNCSIPCEGNPLVQVLHIISIDPCLNAQFTRKCLQMLLGFHHRCFEEFFPNLVAESSKNQSITTTTTTTTTTSSTNASSSGLLVMARGLGEWRVVVQMFRLCCTPSRREKKPLVLVVNGGNAASLDRWTHLCEWWGKIPREFCPVSMDFHTLGRQRQDLYAQGGCFFVTTRVLIADLLNGIFAENLMGAIVLDAHEVTENSGEAFVLRMIRQRNPQAFVRAFCESPEKLSNGFSRLSTIMKSLGVRKLFLYPRFRQEVRDCLDLASPKIIEIAQPLSDAMREIQSAAVEAMKLSVEEVRRSASVDVSDLTVETALFRSFDMIIKQKLLSDWATVSAKSKQLIDDLKTLRQVLKDLLVLDCVSFYEKLLDVKRKSAESPQHSMFLLTDAGNRMFKFAKARLFTIEKNKALRVVLEPHLKIQALEQVLAEIRETQQSTKSKNKMTLEMLGGTDIVCLVHDEQTMYQVAQFLSSKALPSLPLLQRRFLNYLIKAVGSVQAATVEQNLLQQEMERLRKLRGELPSPPIPVKPGDQQFHPRNCYVPPSAEEEEEGEVEFVPRSAQVSLHMLSELGTSALLDALKPRFIILFDPDVAAMREIECYHASTTIQEVKQDLQVYILFYETSVEEQKHLSNLNQERDAFVRVIQEKSELVFAATDDASTNSNAPVVEDEVTMTYDASTGQMVPMLKKLKRGTSTGASTQKVIVDIRELRSNVPNMLHSSGFVLDARTLEVADYVLSPEVCVERKSLPDLIGSFGSGRLKKQAEMMARHYKRPCLLIEFPDAGPFRLQTDVSSEVSQGSLMHRIVLLTLHFPDMRVIWSKSGRATVDLFRELQRNQLPPDGDLAESLEAQGAGALVTDVPNQEAFELLKHMPGITKDNMYRVARGANSLADLGRMDLETLTQLCESENNAKLLYDFLQKEG